MPVLYGMIWDKKRQWSELNYIIPCHTMVFWEILCSVVLAKIIVVDADDFFLEYPIIISKIPE